MQVLTRRSALLTALGLGGSMSLRGDELDILLAPPAEGQAQPMSYRKGRVITFDRLTLRNSVAVGGSVLTDLPLLGVAEAATLGPGSVVALMAVGSTWAILGRWVEPDSPEAVDAITQVSQRVYTALVAAYEARTFSPAYADLATPGPSIEVEVARSGQALVVLSADIQVTADSVFMGFTGSGANTIAATTDNALGLTSNAATLARVSSSKLVALTGLNPGKTTFKAVYSGGGGTSNLTGRRSITILAF